MAIAVEAVGKRLAEVRSRIEQAGGDPESVTLVAVTKGFGPDAVSAAMANGVLDIGENRAPELLSKAQQLLTAQQCPSDVRWHYLGNVQRNKVLHLAPHVGLWQAVDRLAAGEEIAKRAPGAHVLVQVNVSGEPQKHGCTVEDAPALVDRLRELGLDVQGLMAVGPAGPPEGARAGFRTITTLAERMRLAVRSMGMTDDMEVAVQEGSTMVRIGRALFGDRPRPEGRDLRR